MKLYSIKIENFRCYKNPFKITFNDLTTLIAKNDYGKSAILDALNIYFNESSIDAGDYSIGIPTNEIILNCEFTELPNTVVIDATNEVVLSEEHLLNSENRLEVVKIFSGAKPKLKDVFIKAVHPSIENANDLFQLNINQLRERARTLGVDLTQINATIKAQIRDKIWESFPDLQLTEQLIPVKEDDRKKIWDKLKNEMPLYALFKSDRASTDQDEEAQDPMKIAIKEALANVQADLERITTNVKSEVERIAQATVKKLQEMDSTLASQLNPVFKDPSWDTVFKVSLTDESQVPINKRGSGVRRLILINFFRAKAEQIAEEKNAASVIYAIEEPETSQHPNNQILLMHAFQELTATHNCQVIISTHNPALARLVSINSLRYIQKADDNSRRILENDDTTFGIISRSLGILPDNNIKMFLGVEGANDINFFKSISKILSQTENEILDLEILENEGKLLFIPFGGSNLALWTNRLSNLNRSEIHICDRDTIPPAAPKYQNFINEINQREGCQAFVTSKLELENYLHISAIRTVRPEINITFGDYDDVPSIVAKFIHENNSQTPWDDLDEDRKDKKKSKVKKWLNVEAAKNMTPALLNERDPNDDIRNILRAITTIINT